VTDDDKSVWDLLELHNADPVALVSLQKIMVMLEDALPAFVANLSVYSERKACHRRPTLPRATTIISGAAVSYIYATVVEYCPLPSVLLPIVAEYRDHAGGYVDKYAARRGDRSERPRMTSNFSVVRISQRIR
jgi:hypothetical protein